MQKGGAHISSSFIPVSLLPQLRAEDIPMGSELEITTSHHIQFEDAPMKLDVWTQFEPMSQDHDDGFWRLLYPPPSYSRSALIHQCVVKYGLEMDIEPAKVRTPASFCRRSLVIFFRSLSSCSGTHTITPSTQTR